MKKLLEKYNSLAKPIKASLWFVIANVFMKGISFITLPIFSRILTTNEYGVISVYQSWATLISILTTLTLWGGVFNVGMVKHSDRESEMISSFQGLAITITLTFLGISSLFLPSVSKLLGMSEFFVILMYIEIIVQIPLNLWITQQRYKFKYKKVIGVTIITSILNPILGYVAVISTSYKAEARVISGLLIQVIIGAVLFFYNQSSGKKWFSREFWRFGFAFNIVLVPHYLSTQILSQSDRLMINSLCGSSDAGIYSVAFNFAMLISLVTNGINSSVTPYVFQSIKSGNTKKLYKQTTRVVLIVAILTIGLICIIPDIFTFLLPKSYQEALYVIPPVAAGAFFQFLYPLFGSVEFYYEENRYVTIASIIGAILNVGLNYIFINIFGFIAAAYTTLFCYLCFSVCHYFFMIKTLKKNKSNLQIYDMKAIVLISCFLLLSTLLIQTVYEYVAIRWTIILIVVFAIVVKRKTFSEFAWTLKK